MNVANSGPGKYVKDNSYPALQIDAVNALVAQLERAAEIAEKQVAVLERIAVSVETMIQEVAPNAVAPEEGE